MADEKKLERVYNVPLRNEWLKVVRWKRSKKAITTLKKFIARHMRTDIENVKISKWLNQEIWSRGNKKPPHHIKIRVIKDKDNIVHAEPEILPKEAIEEKKIAEERAKKKEGKKKEEKEEAKEQKEEKKDEEEKIEEEEKKEKEKMLKKEIPHAKHDLMKTKHQAKAPLGRLALEK